MKNMFKFLWLMVGVLAVNSCNSNSHKTVGTAKEESIHNFKMFADSNRNDSLAMAQIEILPEYKHVLKWYSKINKDISRHIDVLLEEHPKNGSDYYQITIGENMPDHFFAMVHFYVNAKDQSVKYLDMETDSLMTLSQWRNSGKDEWK